MPSNSNSLCKVCLQPAFSLHFGVLTCRACGAFFRRRVKDETLIKKSCGIHCGAGKEKEKNLRKHCASCRWKKCLKVGMQMAMTAPISNLHPDTFTPGPIFESLHRGFENLQTARRQAFGLNSSRTAESCTYTVQNTVVAVDFRLIMDNFISESAIFQSLSGPQKSQLLSQFIAPLHIIYGHYISPEPSQFHLANGDYIDIGCLLKFYKNTFDLEHQKAFNVFRPYWHRQNQMMRSYLDEVHLDLTEFLFLVALMLWDIDFHECEEELVEICTREKARVIGELCDYEMHQAGRGSVEDRCLRVGSIVRILHGAQKMLNLLYECFVVAQVYQLDGMHMAIRNSLRRREVYEDLFV